MSQSALKLFFGIFGLLSMVAACSGSGGSGGYVGSQTGSTSAGGADQSGNGSGSSSSGGMSKPAGATAVTCGRGEDCGNWFCDCESGPPVNARNCTNGYCLDASHTCPKACTDFGSTWTGSAGGGPEARASSPSSSSSSPRPAPTTPPPSSGGCNTGSECPVYQCACTNGFTQQIFETQNCNLTTHRCSTKAEACPSACDQYGMSWLG